MGALAFATLAVLVQSAAAAPGAPVTLQVVASKFHFEPALLEVNQGDDVSLVLRSTDVDHGFSLKPYGVKVKVPKGGEPVTVRFVAETAGSFEFSCSQYCGPGHSRMKGRLVVKPATPTQSSRF